MVFPAGYSAGTKPATKRPISNTGSGGASKKVKAEEMVEVDIHETAKKGNLNKLTVPVLKGFCQEKKLKSKTQKKADLIHAINVHFSLE